MRTPTQPGQRREKKSEHLEVRISWSEKQAFKAYCEANGLAASEALRALIRAELEPRPARSSLWIDRIVPMFTALSFRPRAAMASVITAASAGMLAFAAPSMANVDTRAAFNLLDADQSGTVSFDEFLAHVQSEGLFYAPNARADAPEIVLGRDEVIGHLRSEFARYDRDRDGELRHAEFASRYIWQVEVSFNAIDQDRDGAIEREELARVLGARGLSVDNLRLDRRARADGVIEALDQNGDGQLSFAEYTAI